MTEELKCKTFEELMEEYKGIMNCTALDNASSEYNLNRVARVHAMAEFGEMVFPIIEEMWGLLLGARKAYERYSKTKRDSSEEIWDIWENLILHGMVYDKFFVRFYNAMQEAGQRREGQRKKDDEEFERRMQFVEDNANEFRYLIDRFLHTSTR